MLMSIQRRLSRHHNDARWRNIRFIRTWSQVELSSPCHIQFTSSEQRSAALQPIMADILPVPFVPQNQRSGVNQRVFVLAFRFADGQSIIDQPFQYLCEFLAGVFGHRVWGYTLTGAKQMDIIRQAFWHFQWCSTPNDLLIVYFIGHGGADPATRSLRLCSNRCVFFCHNLLAEY